MYENQEEQDIQSFLSSSYRVFLAYADDSNVYAVCVNPASVLDYWSRAVRKCVMSDGFVSYGVLYSETIVNDLDIELAEFLIVQAMICGHSRVAGRKGY